MRFSVWARTPPDPFADPLWESPRFSSHPRPHRTGKPLRSAASASFTYRLVVARAVFLLCDQCMSHRPKTDSLQPDIDKTDHNEGATGERDDRDERLRRGRNPGD